MSKSTEVATTPAGGLTTVNRSGTQVERFQGYMKSMEKVEHPLCRRPIPAFMLEMPWAEDDEEIQERIIAQILASDDPYQAAEDPTTRAGKALVGQAVVIHDVRCKPSDKPGGWGAYLLCDATIGDSDIHQIVTVGAKQAVGILAYAWASGDLPIAGTFSLVTETAEGNTVIGFIRERPL